MQRESFSYQEQYLSDFVLMSVFLSDADGTMFYTKISDEEENGNFPLQIYKVPIYYFTHNCHKFQGLSIIVTICNILLLRKYLLTKNCYVDL